MLVKSQSVKQALIVWALLGSFAWAEVGQVPAPMALSLPGGIAKAKAAFAWVDDALVSLYRRKSDGRVVLHQDGQTQTLDDDAPDKGGKHFRLHDTGKVLYALWWRKLAETGRKKLYMRASKDRGKTFGPLTVLNSAGGVLPSFDFVDDGAGRLAVVYMDERSPGYQIYVNRSIDGGEHWLEHDIRLDDVSAAEKRKEVDPKAKVIPPLAVTPQLVFLGERLVAVWQQQDVEDNRPVLRWLARISEDGGQTWQAPQEIQREPGKNPYFLTALEHQGRVYVIGFATGRGLMAFRSNETGGDWAALGTVPGTVGKRTVISSIRPVASGDNILVSYTLEKQGQRNRVFVATLSAASGKWQAQPWRLDRKDQESTQARRATLASLSDGAVVAVWQDYRNLLPAIYLDYSTDSGKSWLKAPLPLTEPGMYSAGHPQLVPGDDKITVVYDRTDREMGRTVQSLFYQTLPYSKDAGLALPSVPNTYAKLSLEEKKQQLRKRMEEFWTLREQGKFEDTWDYMDPVYRAGFPNKHYWLARQGNLTYSDFAITGDITIIGSIGKVPYKMTASMPQQVLGDKLAEVPPPDEMEDQMTWGWFTDDWYFIPDTMFKRHLEY